MLKLQLQYFGHLMGRVDSLEKTLMLGGIGGKKRRGRQRKKIGRASCRERVETVVNFIFGASKITADGDCSHEIKRRLLLGRKVMTNLHSILKSRDITLPTKVCLVKAMVFPMVMYGCEIWTVKKAEQ